MQLTKKAIKMLGSMRRPWTSNIVFFAMMYLLGCVTSWITIPHYRGAHLYELLYPELFFDLSVVCLLLYLIPKKVRRWVRGLLYVILYVVAMVDVYCFVTYDTTLTPTVMMLMAETNSREAGEFIQTVFSTDVIFGKIGYILLLVLGNAVIGYAWHMVRRGAKRAGLRLNKYVGAALGVALAVAFVWTGCLTYGNKIGLYRLMTARNIGEIEHLLTEKDHGSTYQPIYRLAFSAYANSLTGQEVKKLRAAADAVEVDSCSFTSPEIVLIIGESYSRHHSHQYGYWQETTPRQEDMEKTGRLTKYTDVITPWNLTSFVFKLMFSTYCVGDDGEWCDYPLFPELFKAAGYHVTFLTNQFLPKAREAVYDFSGGFFLNDTKLSDAQFDVRNNKLHAFDDGLLKDYDALKPSDAKAQLTIFHLSGQHVLYRQRSPQDRKLFKRDEYKEAKPHLNARERQTLADYDNAILYNDSIVSEIVKRFDSKEAIVIYVPDHGEECYEGNLHFFCRMHSAAITSRLAHAEFDIPFWIYCTDKYQAAHPEICNEVKIAKEKPYMIDALPHMLMYLAGIHSKEYKPQYNILSPQYDAKRKRILKNTTDYDSL